MAVRNVVQVEPVSGLHKEDLQQEERERFWKFSSKGK